MSFLCIISGCLWRSEWHKPVEWQDKEFKFTTQFSTSNQTYSLSQVSRESLLLNFFWVRAVIRFWVSPVSWSNSLLCGWIEWIKGNFTCNTKGLSSILSRNRCYWSQALIQGSYGSWETWKVPEYFCGIFQDWKVLVKGYWSWKSVELK